MVEEAAGWLELPKFGGKDASESMLVRDSGEAGLGEGSYVVGKMRGADAR
jgi:hypothetical protein